MCSNRETTIRHTLTPVIMRRKPSDYRQPAWLLRTGVWAAALLYSCVVALANTFPRLYLEGQDHGWPFTYMVRDVQPSDADMSIYYGPWPLYEAPLIQFRAAALLANAVIGVALAAVAGAIAS